MRQCHPTNSDAALSKGFFGLKNLGVDINMQAQYKGQYSGLPNRGWGVGIPRLLQAVIASIILVPEMVLGITLNCLLISGYTQVAEEVCLENTQGRKSLRGFESFYPRH